MGQFVRKIYQVVDEDTGKIIYEVIDNSPCDVEYDVVDDDTGGITKHRLRVDNWLKVVEVNPARVKRYGTTRDACKCPAASISQDKPCKHQIALRLGIVSMQPSM